MEENAISVLVVVVGQVDVSKAASPGSQTGAGVPGGPLPVRERVYLRTFPTAFSSSCTVSYAASSQ